MKQTLAFVLYKLMSKLSLKTTHIFSNIIGNIAFILPIREQKVSKINIERIFVDKSKKQLRYLLRKSLQESTKSVLESFPLWQMPANKIKELVNVNGFEHISGNQGIIFVCTHLASWEIINLWLAIHYPLSSLHRNSEMKSMNKIIQKKRQKFGSTMVADGIKGVMILKKALDKNEAILIAPDQDPGDSGSVMVNFFGKPARTSTLVPKLAHKTQAKILLIYTIRQKQRFSLYIEPADKNVYHKNITKATQQLNNCLERIILKAPEQYSWSYKRFKFQTDGSKFYN